MLHPRKTFVMCPYAFAFQKELWTLTWHYDECESRWNVRLHLPLSLSSEVNFNRSPSLMWTGDEGTWQKFYPGPTIESILISFKTFPKAPEMLLLLEP